VVTRAVLLLAWLALIYETVAIEGQRLPTITALIHQHRSNGWIVILVLALHGWLYFHLLVEVQAPRLPAPADTPTGGNP
jgi:hypothetical protein